MRSRTLLLIVVAVAMVVVLTSRATLSGKEERFLRDRAVITEVVRLCFEQPYEGLSRFMPGKDDSTNPNFPGEDHIRRYIHSSVGWSGDGFDRVIYRPDPAKPGHPSVDAAKVLQYYFGRLESSGFTSGIRGFPVTTSTDSMELAEKTWVNKDRTLLLTGQVITDKKSGETIITTFKSETLNYHPR